VRLGVTRAAYEPERAHAEDLGDGFKTLKREAAGAALIALVHLIGDADLRRDCDHGETLTQSRFP
jgi:hypothetical protein